MNHPVLQNMHNKDLGLLLIRFGIGVAFIYHGWQKVENIPGTINFFFTLGLPAIMAYVIAGIECLGGIAMILGIAVRVFGILLAFDMIGAYILVSSKMISMRGFGAFELEFVLMTIALGVAFAGAGSYALLNKKCDDCRGGICKMHK